MPHMPPEWRPVGLMLLILVVTACATMLAQVVAALVCRAHGHSWVDHGDVRTCARCDTVQHRSVTADGDVWG